MNDITSDVAAPPDKKLYDVLHKHRYRELDGLRGIASLMVGIDHGFDVVMVIPASMFGSSFISAATNGNGAVAVDLFFIMSGFFLAGMLENQKSRNVLQFYLRRFVRLAPPAIAAVISLYLFSLVTLHKPPSNPNAAPFFQEFYSFNYKISLKILLLNFALIRHTLNPPLWTIRLELFTSIVFPAVFFLKNHRESLSYRLALFGVFFFAAGLLNSHQKLGIDVFHYLYIFYAGVLIRDFGQYAGKLSRQLQYALFGFAVVGLILTTIFDPTYGMHPILFDFPTTIFGTVLVTLLAFGEINRIRTFMKGPFIQFLGRISYSFYLINWLGAMSTGMLVMHFHIADLYGNYLAFFCVVTGTLATTFTLAYGLHITVEQPATALSRYLSARSKARPSEL